MKITRKYGKSQAQIDAEDAKRLAKEPPEFYYMWGDEPRGYVSCGLYINDVWHSCGYMIEYDALKMGLKYHCPHN